MVREYTDLTEWLITEIEYEVKDYPGGGQETVKTQVKKNKKDGFLYRFEPHQRRPSKIYKKYVDPSYTVVVQYIEKINRKEYLVDIRQSEQHKYQTWHLDIESQKWTHKDITEDDAQAEQQSMREAIETKQRQKQQRTAQIEKEKQELAEDANEFIMTHPTVKSYVEQLKKDKEDLQKEVSKLAKEVDERESSVHYYQTESLELERKNQVLKAQIKELQVEISRLKTFFLWRPRSTKSDHVQPSLSDLMSQLQNISEIDDREFCMNH
jgi:chromosome segregation ATPase